MANEGWKYFTNFANWIDILLMAGQAWYISSWFMPPSDDERNYLNVVGSIVVLLFILKLIYYMRAYEDYAIFVRMVIDMVTAPELL